VGLFTTTAGAIRKGLARTREALGGSLRSLLLGRPVSPEVIDEIEARLRQPRSSASFARRAAPATWPGAPTRWS